MSVVRIRGKWALSLLEQGHELTEGTSAAMLRGALDITYADRARVHGVLRLGEEEAEVVGRVKPGNPAIGILSECKGKELLSDGLELLLYIPPFWPSIDYTFDAIVGILTISANSRIKTKSLHGKPFSITGVKAWPPVVAGAQTVGGGNENQGD